MIGTTWPAALSLAIAATTSGKLGPHMAVHDTNDMPYLVKLLTIAELAELLCLGLRLQRTGRAFVFFFFGDHAKKGDHYGQAETEVGARATG